VVVRVVVVVVGVQVVGEGVRRGRQVAVVGVGAAQEGGGRRHGRVALHERRWLLALVAFAPAQEAAVVEHVLGHRVQRPVVALARVARLARDLDEAVVQTQIVPAPQTKQNTHLFT